MPNPHRTVLSAVYTIATAGLIALVFASCTEEGARSPEEAPDTAAVAAESLRPAKPVMLHCAAGMSRLTPMRLRLAADDKIEFTARGTDGRLILENVGDFLVETRLDTTVFDSATGGQPVVYTVKPNPSKNDERPYHFVAAANCPRDTVDAAFAAEPTMIVED